MIKPTILVVDDEKEIRELIEIYLKNEGYNVITAEDGLEALEIAKKDTIHLIILDIMLPNIDGIQVCKNIREYLDVPIIMLSAKREDNDKILGIITGADDYVTKPFNPLELVVRVKAQLRRYLKTTKIPENNCTKQFDITKILNQQYRSNFDKNNITYYDIKLLGEDRYVVVSNVLYKGDNSELFPLGIVIFLVLFLLLTYGRVKYINSLSKGLIEISKGNLKYRVKVKGRDELSILGKNINYMTEELMNLKEREKEIEKNKDMLIVSVSHDLRTPLTSIIGYIKLIKENYKEKDAINKYIDIIDNKSNRLEELINDLFEYTKLTSCDIKLEKVNISLNEFMRQVVEGMMPVCNQNDLNILLEASNEDLNVNVDPAKMVRVFENIISNAIRYSNKKSDINIKISKAENGAIISIENEGKPLKEEELHKIFDMFYRTDESRNNQTGGSGIGLAIAKSIVELHEGKLWAECEGNNVYFYVLIRDMK